MRERAALLLLIWILSACAHAPTATPTVAPSVTSPPPTAAAGHVASPAFTAIRMLDTQFGWGITDTGVVRTSDGGTNWFDVTPSAVTSLGFGATFAFLDGQHGWLIVGSASNTPSGTLYRTQDGGQTWKSSSVAFASGYLDFVDATHGWMLAGLTVGAGEMGVAIFQTSDGGQTWRQTFVDDPSQPNAATSLPYGGLKDGLTAVDMQNAWVGGIVYTPGVVYLYRTQDSGQDWQLQSVALPSGYAQGQYETVGPQFPSAQNGFLPVHVTSQNGVLLAVYYSHDAGSNWALAPTMIPNGGTMDFVSAADGFVWNGTQFYVTHDGAKTWSTVSPGIAFGDSFAGMDFVSATTGFVLTNDVTGTRTLYKTADGGQTWTAVGK